VRALVIIAAALVIGAGVWLIGRHLSASSSTLADPIPWPVWFFGALIVAMFLVILLHCIHEGRVTRRTVADALRGRDPLTDDEFGSCFYESGIAQVAVRLRRLLAENLECDLSGLIPSDDFARWLELFPGIDSAGDSFFEELAIEFQLTRDCPWPERFGSFDALVRFVVEHALAPKTH